MGATGASAILKKMGNPLLINLGNTSPLHYKNKIVVIHDVAFLRNPGRFSTKFYLYYKFIVARAAREAVKVITVSEFSKKEITELLDIPAQDRDCLRRSSKGIRG